MESITETYIENRAVELLANCYSVMNQEHWKQDVISVKLKDMVAKYGEATPEGIIHINALFVGTTAFSKLDQTLLHELAHLAVGLEQHHNKHFIRCLNDFGGNYQVDDSELSQITNQIKYKWLVIAHLIDGTEFEIGGVHRKTKRYSEYHLKPANEQRDMIKSTRQKVARYEFRPFTNPVSIK